MPTVAVTIDTLTLKPGTTEYTGTYSKASGPSWATVGANGDVGLSNPANRQSPQANISWTLPAGHTFADSGAFTTDPVSAEFSIVSGGGTATLTVSDDNNDTTAGTAYRYTLHLSDGSTIDPRIINY
jgi:hypothetical protein